MNQYQVKLEGLTPLLMHQDNIAWGEKIKAWQKDPANAAQSVSGDDRTPPWLWIGSLYHDGHVIGMNSDNLMTMLREGGAKVQTGKRGATFKKETQSGLMIDQQQWELVIGGKTISIDPIKALIGNLDFAAHIEAAEGLGFELLVKRARVQRAKHVRVRPMFRTWTLVGSLTVIDQELSGITADVLGRIMNVAGALCGLGDWRPSSPASGTFGKFTPTIKAVK